MIHNREWQRLAVAGFCGGCGAALDADAPVLVITLAGIKRPRIRGECCIGQAPPELPARVVLHEGTTKTIKPIRKTATQFAGRIWKHG